MASLKLLLGMIPSTAKIEQEEKALVTEYNKLKSFAGSEKLSAYDKLDKLVNSGDFIQKKKEIESLQYRNSEEYSKEREFLNLQKSKDIVLFYRTQAGTTLKKFRETDASGRIKSYEDLANEVNSLEFREKSKAKNFRETEDYKKLEEYKRLKNNTDIKEYYRFKKSKEYANFLNIDGSARLARYNELKDYVATAEFKKRKEYLLDRKRFEKNEMFVRRYFIIIREKVVFWRLFFQLMLQKEVRDQLLPLSSGQIPEGKMNAISQISDFRGEVSKIILDYFMRKKERKPAEFDPLLDMNMFLYTIQGFALMTIYTEGLDDEQFENTINKIIETYR